LPPEKLPVGLVLMALKRATDWLRGTGLRPYRVRYRLTPMIDVWDPVAGVVLRAGEPVEAEVSVRAVGPIVARLKVIADIRAEYPSPRLWRVEVLEVREVA